MRHDSKVVLIVTLLAAVVLIRADVTSYTLGPNYTADPATWPCANCKQGTAFDLAMPITNSLYDCNPEHNPSLSSKCNPEGHCAQQWGTMGTRNISVYIPASYVNGDEVGVMVTQDGRESMPGGDSLQNIMDNLIGAKEPARSLPEFIWVSVSIAGPGEFGNCSNGLIPPYNLTCPCGDGVGTERFNEYATASDTYARFVSEQVLPFVTNHRDIKHKFPNLKITDDPDGRVAAGCSNGAAAAFKMAFFTPQLFGVSIAYSAALNFLDSTLSSNTTHPLGLADMWVPAPAGQELISAGARKPIRIFNSGNENDFGTANSCAKLGNKTYPIPIPGKYSDFLVANNQTRTALAAKGYDTRYAYGLGACHCDSDMILEDLPDTLVWAWAKWKNKQERKRRSRSLPIHTDAVKG